MAASFSAIVDLVTADLLQKGPTITTAISFSL